MTAKANACAPASGAALLWLFVAASHAEDRPACERFDWPLALERTWFEARDLTTVETGTALPRMPEKGLSLKLKPASDVELAAPASRPSKLDAPRGGVVTFDVPSDGLYQVTISADGWLDVVQGADVLAAESHTGNRDCVGLRKSVRFRMRQGAAAIQVTGAAADAIAVAIRRVE